MPIVHILDTNKCTNLLIHLWLQIDLLIILMFNIHRYCRFTCIYFDGVVIKIVQGLRYRSEAPLIILLLIIIYRVYWSMESLSYPPVLITQLIYSKYNKLPSFYLYFTNYNFFDSFFLWVQLLEDPKILIPITTIPYPIYKY